MSNPIFQNFLDYMSDILSICQYMTGNPKFQGKKQNCVDIQEVVIGDRPLNFSLQLGTHL